MDYDVIIGLIIVAAAVAGFVSLARLVLSNWKAGSRDHEEADALHSKWSRDFEICFNDCMAGARWDPDEGEHCQSVCRSRPGAPLSA